MYLLDTTIFSFMLRNDTRLKLYEDELSSNATFFLSAMTVLELHSGAELRGWGVKRRDEMEHHIGRFTVLPIDANLAQPYARAIAVSRAAGNELKPPDALILASGRHFGLVVLTHDRDMLIGDELGIDVICRV